MEPSCVHPGQGLISGHEEVQQSWRAIFDGWRENANAVIAAEEAEAAEAGMGVGGAAGSDQQRQQQQLKINLSDLRIRHEEGELSAWVTCTEELCFSHTSVAVQGVNILRKQEHHGGGRSGSGSGRWALVHHQGSAGWGPM